MEPCPPNYTQETITGIYERNIRLVYRLAYLYLKNPQDAEDAAQTVFLKLIRLHPDFSSEEHEKAWLITVTKNHCRDILKSFWRTHRTELPPDFSDTADSPSDDRELLSLVFELPARYRELLYLYYYEGYSVRELSKILSLKESTIQTRLAAGRKKLKNLYERSVSHGK